MKKLSILVTLLIASLLVGSVIAAPVSAESGFTSVEGTNIGICTFVKPICDALKIDNTTTNPGDIAYQFLMSRVMLILNLIFVGIILLAVYIIIKASVKYISSQGEEGKIADAQKAIKSVFMGIAVLFLGIAGIFIVLAFFNANGIGITPSPSPGDCYVGADGTTHCGDLGGGAAESE